MKILLTVPGNLKTVPMNRYVLETLGDMGHEVTAFNYAGHGIYTRMLKKLSREMLVRHVDGKLLRLVDKVRPEMLLTIFGFDHSVEAIESVRAKGVTTACWWLNDPFQFERSAAKAGHYDFYFTNSSGSLREYRTRGIKNVHYLPVGIFPAVHKRLPGAQKKYEVSFAGDWSPVREEILAALVKDFNVAIFGPWRSKLKGGSALSGSIKGGKFFTPEEMVGIFNQSKVVLNIHTWFGKTGYGINPRVFEACGSGAFQLCDWKEEIPALYEEDKEIALYRDIGELKEKLGRYLSDDVRRTEVADKAFLKTHQNYTYRHRLSEMLRLCGHAPLTCGQAG